MIPSQDELLAEITFKTSRSGGKGGQNVNKVSSKVELVFSIADTSLFSTDEKTLLHERLKNKIDVNGNLHVVSQVDRSQLANKEIAVQKFIALLTKALTIQKKRKPTKIPKAIIEKRLNNKLANSLKKESRKKPLI